jgi:hypothetical protein
VLSFQLSLAANDLPKELELVDLFLHNILAHFADFFQDYSFARGSTEEGEHIQSFIKQILRNCTDKSKERALNEIFTRLSISLQTKLLFCEDPLEEISVPYKSKVNKEFKTFRELIQKQEDIEITKPSGDDQSDIAKSKRRFFEKIKSRKYPDEYVEENQDRFIYHVAADINKYSK